MDFESANPTVIRSIKQRDLLNTWLRLYAPAQRLPRIGEFQPARIEDELPDLVFLTVEKAKPARLIIDSDGTRMSIAYGHTGKGRYLDEYLGARLAPLVMPSTSIAWTALFPSLPSPMSTTPVAASSPMNACCCRFRKVKASRMSSRH